ncbi:MAG: hypothetical protein KGH79_04870 [Patescibacteria group bacterium]|nr:hypothetical protein [Patescibacteria group bacterium]
MSTRFFGDPGSFAMKNERRREAQRTKPVSLSKLSGKGKIIFAIVALLVLGLVSVL